MIPYLKKYTKHYLKNIGVFLLTFPFLFICCESKNNSLKKDKVVINFNDDLTIPNFIISTIKDSADFNSKTIEKEGLILLKYFSPDCDNCQEEAEIYHSKKDSLKNIRTIWISGEWAQMNSIEEFAKKYRLKELNTIIIGKETSRFLINYYDFSGIPFAALYENNQLIKQYTGSINFEELIDINYGNSKGKP
ncbi:hypothetical protein [Winogradskyella poriferorum]|uniref:hypothetical protein n=1 Tax=Winogradskyella poriferorum TaxID=307627 RepID=UPI003D6510FD